MARALWTPPLSLPSLGDSGRHSGQETIIKGFPKVLGSWWEIFENGDRGSTQNFAGDVVSIVVWPGKLVLEKYDFFKKCKLSKIGMSKTSRNCNSSERKAPQGATRHKGTFNYPKGSFGKLTSTK